jgi:CHAT domain-containing protein
MRLTSVACGLMLLVLAGCEVPPPSAYVSSESGSSATGQPLGTNAVGEACTQQAQGEGAARRADVYCGAWQQPSGEVRTAGPIDASQLAEIASTSAWRQGIEQRYACGQPQLTTILDGVPAAILSCTRRQGGWPHVALVAATGGEGWYADGVLPALPAIQRSIGVLSGRVSAQAATTSQSSSADALLASRLAAQAFSSGDIGQYDTLMLAGSRANQAERFAAAESAFRAALALQEKALGAGNPNTATTLERLALQISNQGRTAEADRLFARAAALAAKSDDPLAAPRLQHYLALNLINEGKYQDALAQLDRAESGYEQRLPAQVLNAHPRRLLVASAAGFDDALANRELLSEPTIRGALAGAIEVRRYRAVVLRALGRDADAEAALASARTLAEGNNVRETIEDGRITRTAGAGDLGRGDAATAARLFGSAATRFRIALPRSRPLAETRLLEASAIAASAGLPAALAACQDGTQILRQEALGVAPEVIAPCLDVFAKSADADPAHRQELLAAMFEAAQLAQGGVTGTQIAQATARLAEGARDPKVADAIRRRQDAGAELTNLDRARDDKVQAASATGAAADTKDLDEKIAAARTALADADAALQAASPNYGQLVQEVVPASAVLQLLRPGEAFVAIDFSDAGGWTFALRDGQVTAARVGIDSAAVLKLVARIRAGVEPTTDALPRFDTDAAFDLYKAVLGGVAPQLQGMTHLVVAPTGPLLSIPFGVLLTGPGSPDQLGKAPWLLRQAAIAHVPAAANFVSLRKIAGTSHATQPWFGFGDFHPVTLAQAQKSFPGGECADSAALFAGLPPLPFAGRELEVARLLLGGRKQDELLGTGFTAPAVMKASLKNYRVLHFATHALLPAELKCQSEAAIVTSAPVGATDATGALLTVSDVVGLDLDADTVILSACNSGGGAVSSADAKGTGKVAGESLSGLARAFFYAGARSLMVTHWSVNDQTAAYLVAETMKRVHSGEGISDALHDAQIGMLNEAGASLPAELAHPFHWAPFALIGDGGVNKTVTAGL